MNTSTLKDLRRGVGRMLQDLVVLTATATSGDNLSFIDVNNLWFPDKSANGRILYFTSGTNAGLKRVITDSNQSLGRVTYGLATTAIPAQGDEAELWRRRGQGYDPIQDINYLISDLVLQAQRYALDHDVATIGVFDYADPLFALPAGTRGVYAVEWEDDDGLWNEIPKSTVPNGPGWSLVRDGASASVRIAGYYLTNADTRDIRIRRYVDTNTLVNDSDTTTISYDWIIAAAKAQLLEKEVRQQDYASVQLWQNAVRDAEMKKAGMIDRPAPSTVMI